MALDPALLSSVRVGELAPEVFSLTDNIAHEVGTELKRGTVQQLVDLVAPLVSALQFQVIELDVNNQYIIDNFDSTGLGTNLCLGFAICNGQNGTKDRNGRTGVAYGTTYTAVGAIGGSATHVLSESEMPLHNHNNGLADDVSLLFVYGGTTDGVPGLATRAVSGEVGTRTVQGLTSTRGANSAHNNLQPYIVTLIIQKL